MARARRHDAVSYAPCSMRMRGFTDEDEAPPPAPAAAPLGGAARASGTACALILAGMHPLEAAAAAAAVAVAASAAGRATRAIMPSEHESMSPVAAPCALLPATVALEAAAGAGCEAECGTTSRWGAAAAMTHWAKLLTATRANSLTKNGLSMPSAACYSKAPT